jgi:NADH-quinone oxidoreductase subunit J
MTLASVIFYLLAFVVLLAALSLLAPGRGAMASATSMFVCMAALSGIFVLLEGHILAVVQLLFYAGVSLVLFLFMHRWTGDQNIEEGFSPPARRRPVLVTGGLLVVLAVCMVLLAVVPELPASPSTLPAGYGGVRAFGIRLIGGLALPLTLVALLLLAAILGTGVLGPRKSDR